MINAEPMSSSANSYVTLAEAVAYFATLLYTEAWDEAEEDRQEKALLQACMLIDESFEFEGVPTTTTQRLRWPRIGVYDLDGRLLDSQVVPTKVKEAQCEMALSLLQRNRLAESDLLGLGFDEVKIGPIQVKLSEQFDTIDLIPNSVLGKLAGLGTPIYPDDSNKINIIDLKRV